MYQLGVDLCLVLARRHACDGLERAEEGVFAGEA